MSPVFWTSFTNKIVVKNFQNCPIWSHWIEHNKRLRLIKRYNRYKMARIEVSNDAKIWATNHCCIGSMVYR